MLVLTPLWLKGYCCFRLTQPHLENYIFKGFQTWAVKITHNPYQGLKLVNGQTVEDVTSVKITHNPYQGLKLARNTILDAAGALELKSPIIPIRD